MTRIYLCKITVVTVKEIILMSIETVNTSHENSCKVYIVTLKVKL